VGLSRRAVLALASTSLVGAAGAGLFWARRGRDPFARGERLADGQPVLRLPFPAGTVVLCQQGNLAPEGRTHAATNCLHALDLSNPAEGALGIVAVAPGRVAFVHDASEPGDASAGLRFGNQVKVEHGDGYFTFYAHLDRVVVRIGEDVDHPEPLVHLQEKSATGQDASSMGGVLAS
jgi:murein DD-endopeptidase MepM/ murein hydrolase activator NlpD